MARYQPDQRIVVAAVYVCTMLLNSLSGTIVNVALATLGREFAVAPAAIEAVVVGYLVSQAVCIPVSGWLGDRWGTKRSFLLALSIFIGASILCGLAPSFGLLVAFRVLQGVGAGLLMPVGMAMLYRAFPPQERVRVSRILMFPTILGPALGPLLGGVLVEKLSWHWAFFANVPLGVAALVFGTLWLQEHREPTAGRFDIPGFALAGVGLGFAVYALSEGPSNGWTSPGIVICGLVGLTALAAFVAVELRVAQPMVQLRLLSNRLFRSTLLVSLFSAGGFMGILFLVPLFLQEARGDSPLASGLTTFPEAIGVVVSTQLVARLYPTIGPRRLMAGGLLGVSASMAALSFVTLETNAWAIRALMFLIGVGMAYVFLPNQAAGFATISRQDTGQASTISNTQRQVGGAFGIAVLSGVLAAVGSGGTGGTVAPPLEAFRAAFLAAAGLSLIGALLALRVPDADAAATMRPRGGAGTAAVPEAVGKVGAAK